MDPIRVPSAVALGDVKVKCLNRADCRRLKIRSGLAHLSQILREEKKDSIR